MALTATTYNDNFNEMPFAYLRTKIVAPFIDNINTQQVPQRQEPTDLCDCCDIDKRYIHLAIADISDSDTYKNDYLSQLFKVPIPTTILTFQLQKFQSGSWSTLLTLDSSYGTTYNVGIFPDAPLFGGYRLQWRPVLTNFDEGIYRIKTIATVFVISNTFYSDAYCLKHYSIDSANQTTKFEWNNNGIITYADDDFVRMDYANINWMDMLRVRGSFGYVTEEQETVDVDLFYGNAIKTQRIHDKTQYKYKFKSAPYPFNIHSIIRNIMLRSNSLVVTTYGKLEKKDYIRKAIIKESDGYSPNYERVYNKWFKVEINFRDKYEDLGARKNCSPSGNNSSGVTILDESGDIITTVPDGGIYVDNISNGNNVIVSNSDDSYSISVACGDSLELPDTTFNVYLDGGLLGSITTPTLSSDTINITW